MAHTTYVNASGLPDDDQVTTARDQALLGRAIQERFPRFYRYFSTESFVYHGEEMRNHNHLLGAVDGVDGIKTGFTRASGFNLLTSLHRDGRYLVAVVMGGPSASERDERMRELISAHIKEAAVRRTAPMIAEAAERRDEITAKLPVPRPDRASTATVDARSAAGSNDPIRPLLVKTISYRTVPVQTASLAPMPALVPVTATAAPPAPQPVQPAAPAQATSRASTQPRPEIAATTSNVSVKLAQAEPSTAAVRVPAAAQAAQAADVGPARIPAAQSDAPQMQPAQIEPAQVEPAHVEARTAVEVQTVPAYTAPPAHNHSHSGWLIQIGAYDDEAEAKQHLSAAQIKVHAPLAAKDPFTERVQKGDKALYRARFAGFDKATAEAACRALKRSEFECMALKD
jgi:D-alanyl-D-alanine carboxypeptidase